MAKKNTSKNKRSLFTNVKKYIVPPLVGFIVMFVVFGIFNSQYISGKFASVGNVNSNEETAIMNDDLQNSQADDDIQNTIKIAALGVNAPIIEAPENSTEETFQQLLQNGVVHYPQTAQPGNKGNVVVFGHSSGRWWAPGDYKFVFSKLEKLDKKEKIFIDYAGERFMYEVTDKQIVAPTEVSVLTQTDDYRLTLITCHPVGSNAQRLIITAKQLLPKPTTDQTLQKDQTPADTQTLPAQTPSFWDNVRSLF